MLLPLLPASECPQGTLPSMGQGPGLLVDPQMWQLHCGSWAGPVLCPVGGDGAWLCPSAPDIGVWALRFGVNLCYSPRSKGRWATFLAASMAIRGSGSAWQRVTLICGFACAGAGLAGIFMRQDELLLRAGDRMEVICSPACRPHSP